MEKGANGEEIPNRHFTFGIKRYEKKIMNLRICSNEKIDVKGLNSDPFILIIKSKEITYYGKLVKI